MKKFRVNYGTISTIDEIEILSETDKQVTLKSGGKAAKKSSYTEYVNSYEEAKELIIKNHETEIAHAENSLKWEKHNYAESLKLLQ